MREPIVVPDLGGSAPVLSLWFVRPGEQVYAGDRVIEVLLGSATVDLSAPCSGRLAQKLAWPRESLVPGQVLGYIDTADEEG